MQWKSARVKLRVSLSLRSVMDLGYRWGRGMLVMISGDSFFW